MEGPSGELCSGEVVEPVVDEDQEEETRNPRPAARPIGPTKAQIDEHYPLHLHYRSWCPDCVWGKAHAKHHRSSEDVAVEDVTWHIDYCFFTKVSFE